ncbi:MAG TPA: DinB family protein, partial [Chitinophagaceae bacterium]|nr:DinB family protein [Chitinophagaceae bacterium]
MKEQLLETWRIHNKMNLLLIDNIKDTGMEQSLSPPGRTVYYQLVHVHNVRIQWLEVCAPDIFKKYHAIKKETGFDREGLRQAFDKSAAGIEELINKSLDNEGRVKNFKKGIIPLVGYFISHESHHRGSILL